ncbi:hypothetical protein [Campylobacter geochelonis]|uniref:TrkA domain-containing protein n=1 Tax=Campylobacter geochelonis TaxID=1780362 RepID=A0A128EK92_9BACT|nr:hypothetical protein [Campylobacter geochelonis]QKF71199.1 TrkA domain-containing protein [Campylobacter geochelonis]CZE48822.1 TrkA domain-containing protein [Campylobacter geochelonis]CZE49471.1 TrkA domain-containing protein [Campylobacter geochelonis]CZE51543.1 TrkA domain-containing protein [Campylobacter geochelonis]
MKKILIIAGGILAKDYLERVFKIKNVVHDYTVISYDDKCIPQYLENEPNFTVHKFDPTSMEKLRSVANLKEFENCIIILDNELDSKITYKNIRIIEPELELYLIDVWGFAKKYEGDSHLKIVDILSISTSRLIGFLPDSPVYADNIGLGKGEIMEVKVPISSSFAYKKVGMFLQSKYKIPMIYRHNEYIVTKYDTTILPNDSLLLVGEPSVLRNVFSAIKQEKGQFPSPFGINLYLILDLKHMKVDKFNKIIRNAKFLNDTFSNLKLYIRVINPTISTMLDEVKKLNEDEHFEVFIDYINSEPSIMKEDIQKHKVGMVLAQNSFFEAHKEKFYHLKVPVLTLGRGDIKDLKKSVIIVSSKNTTQESSVVFDVSGQLGLDVYLYYFDQSVKGNKEIVKYYENLSNLFKRDLHVVDNDMQNPISVLEKESEFIQFLPFDEKILKRKITSSFSKDLDELYYKLEDNYQLFVPSFYEI